MSLNALLNRGMRHGKQAVDQLREGVEFGIRLGFH